MKIITHPNIHVLSASDFRPHPEYEVPDHDNDGEKLIAHAGKGCYDSYGKDGRNIEDHINSLVNSRHGSVLEHVNVSFFISGISRGCSHEVVRHRHFSYSQRSTRYTEESGAAIVLDPYYAEMYALDDVISDHFITSCRRSLRDYALAVEMLMDRNKVQTSVAWRKWARGKARQLLPHALETRMTMTGNLRSWWFFCEERTSRHAEPEIRRLAELIFTQLRAMYPAVFDAWTGLEVDGFMEVIPPVAKV